MIAAYLARFSVFFSSFFFFFRLALPHKSESDVCLLDRLLCGMVLRCIHTIYILLMYKMRRNVIDRKNGVERDSEKEDGG